MHMGMTKGGGEDEKAERHNRGDAHPDAFPAGATFVNLCDIDSRRHPLAPTTNRGRVTWKVRWTLLREKF